MMHRRRGVAAVIAAAAGFLMAPGAAAGQAAAFDVPYVEPGTCTASIPDSAMRRVGVYLSVDVRIPDDSSTKLATPSALALSRAAVVHVREMLGAASGQIPPAEPVVTWRDAGGILRITAHRSGGLSVTSNPDRKRSDASGGLLLLESGLISAINAGAKLEWPAGLTTDSLVFDLRLDADNPPVGVASRSRNGQEALFTVMMPVMEPTMVVRPARIHYPSAVVPPGLAGFLNLTFLVDTAGRADMESVRDIWPIGRPRLTGEMGRYYDAFVRAVRAGLPAARFSPARIGGCPVKIWVQQSFDFRPFKPAPP